MLQSHAPLICFQGAQVLRIQQPRDCSAPIGSQLSWPLPSFATMGTTSSSFSALQDICCLLALLLKYLEVLNAFIFVSFQSR